MPGVQLAFEFYPVKLPVLREMLAEMVADTHPLWGSFGFPYRCGVTPADFTSWALAPSGFRDDTLQWAQTTGTMLKHFCHDCPIEKRIPARIAGTCIQPILQSYHGGGRPPKSPRRLEDVGQSSTVRQARAATLAVAPPRGDRARAT